MAATTDTTTESIPGNAQVERLREAFARLTVQQRMILAIAVAALIAVLVGGVLWAKQPDFRVLFSNLSEKDGGAIITALEQQNIPHKFAESSGAILVPAERVHEVRLRLASQGLPRGGSIGFEIMENPKFGLSQFAEQVNYQRALEGELARTIQSVGAVQAARVHLAIPKPSVFVREEQKPTASVLLTLYPGRALDPAQVAGIGHLVSSSVPQMTMGNVTVLDQNGNLLSQIKSKLTEAGLDPAQIKYVREVENSIIKRVEDILKPVLGESNYKVQVAADIDFSLTEQTAETFRPNNTPESTVIRSQQNTESANINATTGGVPGALTNQPPVPATAPLTTPAVGGTPGPAAKTGEAAGKLDAAGVTAPLSAVGQPLSTSKNSTINYELDKTIRHTKQSMGAVRRLSAAVVVNHRKDIGKDGKPITKPLPDAELKQINELVREAMGFSKDRGDSLSIANAPFTPSEKPDAGLPLWQDPNVISGATDFGKWLVLAAFAAFLWLKVIQPLLKTMFPPAPEPRAGAGEGAAGAVGGTVSVTDEEFEEEELALSNYAAKIKKAREIADKDPKVVANMIKEWMGSNAT
ncbi:MAG TPA: flagellar basal-body MS-ring/collar protein FliF [Rhodocyclaceae bacterium]|nr:flagellar basal-body MS-ring/collar protein FliF [Rhodocyclaceae bacterium]